MQLRLVRVLIYGVQRKSTRGTALVGQLSRLSEDVGCPTVPDVGKGTGGGSRLREKSNVWEVIMLELEY